MEAGERKYSNKDITVYWKSSSCIHASACINGLPEVFRPDKKPWVDLEASVTEKIIEVVDKCPVDALTWKWNDEEKNARVGAEHPNHIKNRRRSLMADDDIGKAKKVTVRIMENGPYLINGGIILEKENGVKSMFSGTVSLCRCGESKMKPFCDGSHRKAGFKA